MNHYCKCGKKIESSSLSIWQRVRYDSKGNVIEGICIHNVHFNLESQENV